jgi:DNA-binding NarL/FixJ family response regulator
MSDLSSEMGAEDLSQVGTGSLLQELSRRALAAQTHPSLFQKKKQIIDKFPNWEDTQGVQFMLGQYCQIRKEKLTQQVEPLSHRERVVLVFLAEGLRNREIALKLSCKPSTVKTHIERIADKFNARNRAAIVATAFRLGIIV